jgi:hypothetical protein
MQYLKYYLDKQLTNKFRQVSESLRFSGTSKTNEGIYLAKLNTPNKIHRSNDGSKNSDSQYSRTFVR